MSTHVPKIPKPAAVPRYLAHLKKPIDHLVEIHNKGVVVSSSSIVAERLRDGRIALKISQQFLAGLTAPVSPSVTLVTYDAGSGYSAADVLTAVGGTFSVPF